MAVDVRPRRATGGPAAGGARRPRPACPARRRRAPARGRRCWASTPTTPPPRITMPRGRVLAVVISRFVQGCDSASPGMGGSAACEPLATTTAVPASRTSPESSRTRRSPSSAPRPRCSAMPRSSSQGSCAASSSPWMTSSRRASTAATSSSPAIGLARARDPPGLGECLPGPAAPWRACTPIRSTRRRRAGSRRRRRGGRPAPAARRAPRPPGRRPATPRRSHPCRAFCSRSSSPTMTHAATPGTTGFDVVGSWG